MTLVNGGTLVIAARTVWLGLSLAAAVCLLGVVALLLYTNCTVEEWR